MGYRCLSEMNEIYNDGAKCSKCFTARGIFLLKLHFNAQNAFKKYQMGYIMKSRRPSLAFKNISSSPLSFKMFLSCLHFK